MANRFNNPHKFVSFDFSVNPRMFTQLSRDVQTEISKAMIVIKKRLRRYARENINSGGAHRYENDTGLLKRSTTYRTIQKQNSIEVQIYVDNKKAPYGKYIINGFGTWKADGFLDKTLIDNEEWILKTLNKAVNNATVKFNRRR